MCVRTSVPASVRAFACLLARVSSRVRACVL